MLDLIRLYIIADKYCIGDMAKAILHAIAWNHPSADTFKYAELAQVKKCGLHGSELWDAASASNHQQPQWPVRKSN
jgi:hypothetical protein